MLAVPHGGEKAHRVGNPSTQFDSSSSVRVGFQNTMIHSNQVSVARGVSCSTEVLLFLLYKMSICFSGCFLPDEYCSIVNVIQGFRRTPSCCTMLVRRKA